MARGPKAAFGGPSFRRNISQGVYAPNHSADVSRIGGQLADAVQQFGGRVRELADERLTEEGLEQAARDGQAGTLAPRGGRGADDRAYDQVARERQSAQRRAAFAAQVDQLELDHGESPAAFTEAFEAARAAYVNNPTGDARIDLDFQQFSTLAGASALSRVRSRAETRRRDVARAALITGLATEREAVDRAVTAAPFDAEGAQLVGAQLNRYLGELARHGPRTAFSIGDIAFEADPSRTGAVDAETIARAYEAAAVETRTAWIVAAGDRLQGSAAKAEFAGSVRERWQAGDPMFAGLAGEDMDRLVTRLEADARRTLTDETAAVNAAGARARDMLRALEYGGDVDPEQLRAVARASGDVGLVVEVDYRLAHGWQSGPGARGSGNWQGVAGAGFDSAVGFLLRDLEGSALVANDNNRGRARYGITEASHPEAWRDGDVSEAEARAIYRRDYWDAIGADNLPPDLAAAAFAAAVVGGVGAARALLRQSGGDVDRFLELEQARFERLARENPAQYADDLAGWRNRLARVRGFARALQGSLRERDGFANDPMSYAAGSATRPALASVAVLDPGAAFAEGGAAPEWGQALASRRATAAQLNSQYGVPARMLTDAEAGFYRDRLERNPAEGVQLAVAAVQAVGVDGARDLLREVGRGAGGIEMHLATLATSGNHTVIVERAVEGMALKAGGARAASYERGEQTIVDRAQELAPALAALPGVLSAAIETAELARLADSQRGQVRSVDWYLNSALGATSRDGRVYGGPVELNGAMTLVPDWLDREALEDALEIAAEGWVSAGRGPVYANGQPIPASWLASRMQLRAMPNGRYRLVNPQTGRYLPAASGAAFEFDIERPGFRDLLRRRLPGAVLRGR